MESLTLIPALVLGVVQGVTEFLPVSSSGHLVIFQHLFGFTEPPLLFDVLLHAATLAAVVIYFRRTLLRQNLRFWLLVALATVPAVIGGIIIGEFSDQLFSSLILLGLGFWLTAYWVYQSDRLPSGSTPLTRLSPVQVLVIGIYQAIAILPSVSRSGATIYAGVRLSLNRSAAISFAFIMSIPAILGANLYAVLKQPPASALPVLPVAAGMLAALVTGLLSLRLLERLVIQARLKPFAVYAAVIGTVCLLWGIMS